MFRIPLPNTDTALQLHPHWSELPALAQIGILLLLILVPVVLVIALYRYELRLVSPLTASGLLLLRLVVLVVIIFLVGFQPVLGRTVITELPGRVLVAVDRSASMDIADPQRLAVDKLRLARVLKVAGDLCSDKHLNEWIRLHEANRDVSRELSEQHRQLYDQVCQRVDALTRTQVEQRLLSSEGVRLLQTIAARHQVELLGFTQESWDVKPDAPDELFQKRSADGSGQPETRRASGFTDLHLPLSRALERSGTDQGKILGIVLLTDGQHNTGPAPVTKAIELGEHGLPIFPVALGTRKPPPDVALTAIKAPPTVFKDVDTVIEARFKVSSLPAQKIVVELQRPGQAPLEEILDHDGSDRYYSVRFQVRLDKVGSQALTVAARPVAGETRTDNNSRPVVINVAADQARVLIVEGEARWEYHYLASALHRDRTMRLQSVVFNQPRLGKIAEDELQKAGNPRLTLPTEADALTGYDCIVLGDVDPLQLHAEDRVRLEKYVADQGGTLVILAGKRFMPLAYQSAAGGNEEDPLLRLLPIEQPRVVKPVQGFPVTLTYEGKLTPFLQMELAPDKNESRWAEFPRHYWGIVGRAKPGAASLAFLTNEQAAAGKKDTGEQEKEQALIARHNYGFGRVLFVGLDSTWRWRYKVGDTYHHRFWGQVMRWAAADKPLVTGNEAVRFGTRESVYKQGQQVDVVVRLADEVTPLRPEALAGARLLRQENGSEESAALVLLQRRPAQPRLLEGRVRDLPPGAYAIELVIPELADKLTGPAGPDGRPDKLRANFTVTAPDSEEMIELATNWPLLEDLAARSGGKVFTPEDAASLVALLTRQSVAHRDHYENRLWQWWPTLVLVLSLLTVEWVARKWVGLP